MNRNTAFGFEWNNLSVERQCEHRTHGSFLVIITTQQTMEIRVTKGGKISIYSHEKNHRIKK